MSIDLNLTSAIFSAMAAAGSVLAAVGANRAAYAMRDLEIERRRGELTPTFNAALVSAGRGPVVEITLAGPNELGFLDFIAFHVRNVGPDVWVGRSETSTGPNSGDDPLRSPWRFAPAAHGVASRGALLKVGYGEVRPLAVGQTLRCAVTGPELPNGDLNELLRIMHESEPGVGMNLWAFCGRNDKKYHWAVPVRVLDRLSQ